jgi:DNA polymerase-3 subunit gamma/tau
MTENAPQEVGGSTVTGDEYVVVARRYRPQNFEQLIGQQMATKALKSAISTNRVGHAYLFTGARGVGKTSTARIFSKALNCIHGPTGTPCGECDICQSIASGEDVDVLEIDGASNRGIDEIRQLRSNVAVRPSRARFKIYIIDEVHMLTRDAFNALLKTLEEPPDHVKFIFCTTEPEKIPITVLSRCQRFDFAPVEKQAIIARLKEIVAGENATAEDRALELLARRAAGSLRDSQSLLEQLLAFAGSQITVDSVHALLGTADLTVVEGLATALLQRKAAEALQQLDAALQRGADVGQVAEQLLGYLRDVMAATVGASADLLRHASETDLDRLREWGGEWGIPSLLAAVQILDQALVRLRQSVDPRTVVETALVRISCLEDLTSVAGLLAGTTGHSPPRAVATPPPPQTSRMPAPKKKRTSSGS